MSGKVNDLGNEENDAAEAGTMDMPEIPLDEVAEGSSDVESTVDTRSQVTDANLTNLHQVDDITPKYDMDSLITPEYGVGSLTSEESVKKNLHPSQVTDANPTSLRQVDDITPKYEMDSLITPKNDVDSLSTLKYDVDSLITPEYDVGSLISEESVKSVGIVAQVSAVLAQRITMHASGVTDKDGKNSYDLGTTSSARLNIGPEKSIETFDVDNDVSTCEECQEMDLEFPLYLEELKNEIMQKVITMSSVRGLDSGRDLSEIICRICYDDSDDVTHPAITMCNCRGSVGLVHVHCLEKWLNQKTTDTCELCQHKFNTKFQATEPSILRSMLKFLFLTDRSRTFAAPNCFLFIAQALTVTFLLVTFHLFALSFVGLLLSQPQQDSFYSRYSSNICVLLLIVLINWLYSTLLLRETLTQYWIWYHWWLKTFTVKLILSRNTTDN